MTGLLQAAYLSGLVDARTAAWVCVGLLSACGSSSRPAALSDWDACVVRSAELGGEDASRIDANRPGHSVLYLSARWGESAFRSEYQFAFLQVQLDGDVRPGTIAVSGSTRAIYREGSQMVAYEARHLEGNITVAAIDGDDVTARLALRATPTIDLQRRGVHVLDGEVHARIVRAVVDCN